MSTRQKGDALRHPAGTISSNKRLWRNEKAFGTQTYIRLYKLKAPVTENHASETFSVQNSRYPQGVAVNHIVRQASQGKPSRTHFNSVFYSTEKVLQDINMENLCLAPFNLQTKLSHLLQIIGISFYSCFLLQFQYLALSCAFILLFNIAAESGI